MWRRRPRGGRTLFWPPSVIWLWGTILTAREASQSQGGAGVAIVTSRRWGGGVGGLVWLGGREGGTDKGRLSTAPAYVWKPAWKTPALRGKDRYSSRTHTQTHTSMYNSHFSSDTCRPPSLTTHTNSLRHPTHTIPYISCMFLHARYACAYVYNTYSQIQTHKIYAYTHRNTYIHMHIYKRKNIHKHVHSRVYTHTRSIHQAIYPVKTFRVISLLA